MTKLPKWIGAIPPEKYLERWPTGPKAALARVLTSRAALEGDEESIARLAEQQRTGRYEPTAEEKANAIEVTANEPRDTAGHLASDTEEEVQTDIESDVASELVKGEEHWSQHQPSPVDPVEAEREEEHGLVAQVRSFIVQSNQDYEHLAGLLRHCKEIKERVELRHRGNIKRWYDGHKQALKELNEELSPINLVIALGKEKAGAFAQQQELLRRQAELERERIEKEQRQQLALAEAERLSDFTNDDDPWAEEEPWESEVPAVLPPVVPPPLPTGTGLAVSYPWKYELLDITKASRQVLTWDESKVRDLVRALGPDAAAIIGEGAVRIYQDTSIAIR